MQNPALFYAVFYNAVNISSFFTKTCTIHTSFTKTHTIYIIFTKNHTIISLSTMFKLQVFLVSFIVYFYQLSSAKRLWFLCTLVWNIEIFPISLNHVLPLCAFSLWYILLLDVLVTSHLVQRYLRMLWRCIMQMTLSSWLELERSLLKWWLPTQCWRCVAGE